MNGRLPVVVLVKPPERSRFSFGAFSLAVLASAIRDLAEISIIDATDLSRPAAAEEISASRPDWIGITTMALPSLPPVCSLIGKLREKMPVARIVVGGHGASMQPGIVLAAGADAVVRGEGETALRMLLGQGLQPDLPGVLLRGREDAVRGTVAAPLVQPLDRLPMPARDLMPEPKDGVHLMETSRGCPHSCLFCETTRFYNRRWRAYSPGRVTEEVRQLVGELGAWIIEITDDNFAADHRRVLAICERLQTEELPAFFLLSARADDLLAHAELLPAMAKVRMLRISVGVETLSPSLARSAGKYIPLATYRELFARMRSHGMFSVASFIVGLPGETEQDRVETLDKALEAAPDAAQFIPFYPFPEVPLAACHKGFDPAPDAVFDAARFTRDFYSHGQVRSSLNNAARGSDVRALLARGTLKKYRHHVRDTDKQVPALQTLAENRGI